MHTERITPLIKGSENTFRYLPPGAEFYGEQHVLCKLCFNAQDVTSHWHSAGANWKGPLSSQWGVKHYQSVSS